MRHFDYLSTHPDSGVVALYSAFNSRRITALFAVLAVAVLATPRAHALPCAGLVSLKLPSTAITLANVVATGVFTPSVPDSPAAEASQFSALPAFCRVAATLTPSSDSNIRIEVWLPVSGWNGKFQGVGSVGFGGVINYPALAAAVKAGYAAASTDTGHQGNTAAFALGHPEKLVDFAYRAIHEMTVQAKAIVSAYYDSAPTLSFWNGCSQGGRQGITEAAKYPSDYDGIVAGASGIYWISLMGARLSTYMFVHRSAGSYIPPAKYALLHEAVLKACDALDGLSDGVIENPTACHFDPNELICEGADGPTCLTSEQVETARALYSPIKNPRTNAEVMRPLLEPGSELGWAILAGPQPLWYTTDIFRYLVFKDPDWDWHQFNAATDFDLALKADNGLLEFTDPNLKPFFDRGGKLLIYHGWADPQITPLNSVKYFDDVVEKLGAGFVGKSIQLYMVPGMNHCRSGPGTDTFNMMVAIEQWIADHTAPKQIIASHLTNGIEDRTRPLCPYPQVAAYKGTGRTDDAANFVCKTL
jgi:feruloyl esterase